PRDIRRGRVPRTAQRTSASGPRGTRRPADRAARGARTGIFRGVVADRDRHPHGGAARDRQDTRPAGDEEAAPGAARRRPGVDVSPEIDPEETATLAVLAELGRIPGSDDTRVISGEDEVV